MRSRILALLLALGACAPGTRAPAGPPNVVLICLDTVRADHLGLYGHTRATTPALDALAARATVFEDANSAAGWTKPSVPSFLTGTYPSQHGVWEGSAHGEAGDVTDVLPQSATTLAEVFQQHGYATAAFVHNAQLRAGNGFEQGFDTYVQESLDARELRWHGLDWLDERTQEAPFFLYLHYLDAHWPYPAPDAFASAFASLESTARFRGKDSKALYDAINDGKHELGADDRAALEALYDGAIHYIDAELGKLLEGLAQRGLDQDTIVCVVADHGEEFGEHGKVGHGHGLWQNLLHVPWVLFVPGRPAQRVTAPVSLIDLFPTLLAAAGLSAPAGHEGIDRLADPRSARPILAEHKAPDRYFQTLRQANEKVERIFTAPETKADADQLIVQPGTRWEAGFTLADGRWLVRELKPDDGAPEDPPELKGPIAQLGANEFELAGLRVQFDERTRRQTGEGTAGPELAEGLLIKVRGPIQDGRIATDRLKFYPPADAAELSLRGTVEAIHLEHGQGELRMAGQTLVLTPESNLRKALARASRRSLTREAMSELVAAGAGAEAESRGFSVARSSTDLGQDPGELSPRSFERGTGRDAELDALFSALATRRHFGSDDRRTLDSEALKALQEIGYGGD